MPPPKKTEMKKHSENCEIVKKKVYEIFHPMLSEGGEWDGNNGIHKYYLIYV